MLLAWIIFAFIAAFSLYDIKKSIILWMPVRLLFNPQIALTYTSPAMSLDIGVILWLIAVYFFKCYGKERKMGINMQRSFIIPICVAFLLSFGLSFLCSINITTATLTKTVKFYAMYFGFVYIFQKTLCTKKDVNFLLKIVVGVVLLITILGIYQVITNDNPFLDYVYMNSPHNETTEGRMFYTPPWLVNERILRYGMIRCCSFFSFHVPFGAACVMLAFLMAFLLKNNIMLKMRNYFTLCLVLLCIGLIISNSKQAYVGALVLLFSFYNTKEIFSYRFVILIVFIIALFFLKPEIFNNYLSLFDEDLAEQGGGSTVAMRKIQYDVALKMFSFNPLFGNGPFSLETMKHMSMEFEMILGAESIFLSILPERGIIGVIVYFYMYHVLNHNFSKIIPHRQLRFFLLAYFVMEITGGQKDMTLFLCILVTAGRIMQLNYPPFSR